MSRALPLPLLFASLGALGACGGSDDAKPGSSASSSTTDASSAEPVTRASVDPAELDKRDDPVLRRVELDDPTLYVDVLREGTGRAARPGDAIAVYYEGRREDATEPFVTTHGTWVPARWVLDAKSDLRPIEGLRLAMLGATPGTRARVHVPGHLAYGAAGAPGSGIEAHEDLIFDVLVAEVVPCER